MCSDLPARWTRRTLGEVSDWLSGGTPNTCNPAYWGGDIPWITASSLRSFYLHTSERRVTVAGLQNGTRLVPAGTVIFIVRGMSLKTEFRVGVAQRPLAFGQDCKAIVGHADVDNLYLANVMRARSGEILAMVDEASHGTGRLQTRILQALRIDLPPLPEQRRIAAVLGALDDKIELNRKMNRTLEEMAQALFKSWFIDFDGHDDLVDSELGPIPRGWTAGVLGDVANLYRDGVDPSALPPDYPYVGLADMPEGSISLSEWGTAREAASNKTAYEARDILFGKLRPYFKKVGVAPSAGVCSSDILVIRPKDEMWWSLILGVLTYDPFIAFTSAVSTGTRMPRVSWESMSGYGVVIAPSDVNGDYNRVISSFVEKIIANNNESRTLTELRDTLLPKLISGELRVPESKPPTSNLP